MYIQIMFILSKLSDASQTTSILRESLYFLHHYRLPRRSASVFDVAPRSSFRALENRLKRPPFFGFFPAEI